jgi:hypothetical protein
MAGLIWFVQIVHYPLFAQIPDEVATAYAVRHQSRTTLIVAPTMLVELIASIGLVTMLETRGVLPVAAVGLLALAWVSTFAVQVPLHAKLLREPSAAVVRRLVVSNWVRTVAWSGRFVIAGFIAMRY